MEPLDFAFGLVFLGTVTGIIKMVITAFTSRGTGSAGQHPGHPGHATHQNLVVEPRSTPDHVRALEAQLLDVRLQKDELQKQLEWHNRLLDTQHRLMDRIGTSQARPAAARVS